MKQNVYDNAVKTIVLANPLLSFIPHWRNPNLMPIGTGFGFFVFIRDIAF